MYITVIFLILVYFNVEIISRDIEVVNSGQLKLRPDDMIMVFFVTIHHHGIKSRSVMATMNECCEKVTEDDIDCNVVQIHGEHLGVVQPGEVRNITFLFPNIYPYNRKGSCTISIWNRGEDTNSDQIRHKIEFDTTLRPTSEKIPFFLQGYYLPAKAIRCETTDLDPFDGCNPVDCRLKYLGLRNHFNHRRKRCQKVPTCVGDPAKELPDVAYVPHSNTCSNLEKTVTEEDIRDLLKNKCSNTDKADPIKMVNVQCHHGEIDVRTGLCICDKDWKSEIFDPEAYSNGSVYHMCDKRCHPDAPPRLRLTPFAIGVALALWIMFLVMLCDSCDYICEFYRKKPAEEEEMCYYQVLQ